MIIVNYIEPSDVISATAPGSITAQIKERVKAQARARLLSKQTMIGSSASVTSRVAEADSDTDDAVESDGNDDAGDTGDGGYLAELVRKTAVGKKSPAATNKSPSAAVVKKKSPVVRQKMVSEDMAKKALGSDALALNRIMTSVAELKQTKQASAQSKPRTSESEIARRQKQHLEKLKLPDDNMTPKIADILQRARQIKAAASPKKQQQRQHRHPIAAH